MTFLGPPLKIERAEHHIAEIESRIAAFVDTYFDGFVENTDV
jgi:hypothetical protein